MLVLQKTLVSSFVGDARPNQPQYRAYPVRENPERYAMPPAAEAYLAANCVPLKRRQAFDHTRSEGGP